MSRGVPHHHLPKVEGGFFPGEDEEIDASHNPGRRVAVGVVRRRRVRPPRPRPPARAAGGRDRGVTRRRDPCRAVPVRVASNVDGRASGASSASATGWGSTSSRRAPRRSMRPCRAIRGWSSTVGSPPRGRAASPDSSGAQPRPRCPCSGQSTATSTIATTMSATTSVIRAKPRESARAERGDAAAYRSWRPIAASR